MDYVLFGIQGSGKGTQGKIMSDKMNAAYFETGGELRRLAHENSELGRKVKSIIETGHLVPNEVVMEIVENFVKHAGGGGESATKTIIFDGLPRNSVQSKTFETLLRKMGRDYKGIYFELSRGGAENRLIKRRICSKCKTVYPAMYKGEMCEKCGDGLATRADDNADSIRTRIEIFYKETLPVIEDWAAHGKMITVDGSGTIAEVTKELFKKLEI